MGNYLPSFLGGGKPTALATPLLEVEEDVDIEPLKVKVRLETSDFSSQQFEQDADNNDDAEEQEDLSSDGKCQMQFMHVEVEIPPGISQHLVASDYRCHVIIVADCSSSMEGQPIKQVKEALTSMIGLSVTDPHIGVDVVLYSDVAYVLNYTSKDYESKIAAVTASGRTSLIAAIEKVNAVLLQRAHEEWSSLVIMFMTDGQDTTDKPSEVSRRLGMWKNALGNFQRIRRRMVNIHTVGFRTDQDFKLLKDLCKLGTGRGLFRYSDPSDKPTTLRIKLLELFEYVVYSARPPVDIEVTVDGDNKILAPDGQQAICVPGEIVQKGSRKAQAAGAARESDVGVLTEMWVLVHNREIMPAPSFSLKTVVTSKEARTTKRFPCVVSSVEKKVAEDADSRALWRLRLLSHQTDILASRIATAVEDKKDVSQVQSDLTKLQSRLSNTKIFSQRISKETKLLMTDIFKDIQPKMDTMHHMMAQYTRGETTSSSILARALDLRYEGKFSKSRHQRMLNQRAAKNAVQAEADDVKLQDWTVDEAELGRFSKEAEEFFFCSLSHQSVVEILRDLDNRENTIGFGLAVTRPEYVVSSPTSLDLHLIPGTLLSRSSMLDALEYKIDMAGHIYAHNAFYFFDSTSFGHVIMSVCQEPINAWLPLYVTPTHWERVKMILKPSLGYLCTLDPLGFDWAQLDVLFMVLGAMISQLTDITLGQHRLQMLFAYLRTCAACVEDFNLTDRISNTIREFIREPRGRFKDKIAKLHTLIGYMAALPVNKARQLLGYHDGDENSEIPKAFWYAMLSEMLRRAGNARFKKTPEKELKTLINFLVHGRNWSGTMRGKVQEKASCFATTSVTTTTTPTPTTPTTGTLVSESETAITEKTWKGSSSSGGDDPSTSTRHQASRSITASSVRAAGFTVLCKEVARARDVSLRIKGLKEKEEEEIARPEKVEKQRVTVQYERSADMDRCMELFARSHFHTLQSKEQSQAVSRSKKCVVDWVNQGRRTAGLPDLDGAESEVKEAEDWYDCDHVDSTILDVTRKLLGRLSKRCLPELYSLPGIMAFLHTWLSKDRCFSAMDCGLPPTEWIQEVKAAVAQIYTSMNEHVEQCEQELSNSGHDLDEVVIVGSGGKDGEDVDEEGGDIDYEDPFENAAHKALWENEKQKDEHRRRVTLPMVLHVLDPSADKVKVVRAMLCQAVLYCSNSRAKDAACDGTFLDLKDKDGAHSTLYNMHSYIVKTCRGNRKRTMLWQRANSYLMNAPNIWTFLGYLLNSYTERTEGYKELMTQIVGLKDGSTVPCLGDKVKVLLTGRWKDRPALAKGNGCMVGKVMAKKLSRVLGEEVWREIDTELRSNLRDHVYRESDTPNQHGHCNSNPYIPLSTPHPNTQT